MEHLKALGWNAQLQNEYCLAEASPLLPARVIAVDRDSLSVAADLSELSQPRRVSLAGRLRHQGLDDFAVGDWVGLQETRVDYLYQRRSVFARKRAGPSSRQQVIATNVDWTLVAMSLNDDFSPQRVERYVLAAWDAGTTPLIALTKADLVSDASRQIEDITEVCPGCEVMVLSVVTALGLDLLRSRLGFGQTAVLVGSSGVGKSSLINALVGEAVQTVSSIREEDSKGRHTTTRRQLLRVPETGALLIDSPGMREFGVLAQDAGQSVRSSFSDIEECSMHCAFRDCQHQSEPGCAVLRSIEEGELSEARLRSFRKLGRELAYNERRGDAAKQSEERKIWKRRSQEYRRRTRASPKR